MTTGEQLADLLDRLQDETKALADQGADRAPAAQLFSLPSRCRSTMTKALGPDHYLVEAFNQIQWMHRGPHPQLVLLSASVMACGYLEAAAYEVRTLAEVPDPPDSASVDPELWVHVAPQVAGEAWGVVASQTAIFTEDRIRRWTGQPPVNIGEKLMTAVLGEHGDYRLGLTAGEKNGWHQLGMGISKALRNADAHRIQTRRDHRLYAMGVVGASSLLLTQLRYEHGNRFLDIAPVPLDLTDESL